MMPPDSGLARLCPVLRNIIVWALRLFEASGKITRLVTQSHPSINTSDLIGRRSAFATSLLTQTPLTFTYNGRGALYLLLASLTPTQSRNRVLVPSFHCPTVVDPVLAAGFEPQYYSVKRDLSIDDDIVSMLDESIAAVVLVNFFGFEAPADKLIRLCSTHNIPVIEDCAHSFLSHEPTRLSGQRADATIYSFKKLVPCSTGGAIYTNSSHFQKIVAPQSIPPGDTVKKSLQLFSEAIESMPPDKLLRRLTAKARYVKKCLRQQSTHNNSVATEAPRIARFDYPFDVRLARATIPWYAKRVLLLSHLEEEARHRRRMFLHILQLFTENRLFRPVYTTLPEDTVPWALPVYVENRSQFDIQLREAGVPVFTFGETLHQHYLDQRPDSLSANSDAIPLSDNLLCFPVHRGIGESTVDTWLPTIQRITDDATAINN